MLSLFHCKPLTALSAGHRHPRLFFFVVVIAVFLLLGSSAGYGYSVLAHEAIIDSAWDKIRTLLLQRFPNATPEELRTAHGYSSGGSLVQDLGYHPHGSRLVRHLMHYMRSVAVADAL